MAKTVLGLFETFPDAERAQRALAEKGIGRNDISVIFLNSPGQRAHFPIGGDQYADPGAEEAGAGAAKGAAVGGAAGVALGLAALAIPGIGPVLAAGPLLAALGGGAAGAFTGSLVGAISRLGVPDTEAERYHEGVRRGGVLVGVHTDDAQVGHVAALLRELGAVDIEKRSGEWQPTTEAGVEPRTYSDRKD